MYEVKTIDLTNVHTDDQTLVGPLRRISEIVMMDMPAGATLSLRVGETNPLIPISRPFSMEPKGADESNRGLFYQNAAQPGVIVTIVVAYAGDELNTVLT